MKKITTILLTFFCIGLSAQGTYNLNESTGGISTIDSNATVQDLQEDLTPTKAITLDGTELKYAEYQDLDTVIQSSVRLGNYLYLIPKNDSVIYVDYPLGTHVDSIGKQ